MLIPHIDIFICLTLLPLRLLSHDQWIYIHTTHIKYWPNWWLTLKLHGECNVVLLVTRQCVDRRTGEAAWCWRCTWLLVTTGGDTHTRIVHSGYTQERQNCVWNPQSTDHQLPLFCTFNVSIFSFIVSCLCNCIKLS